jgi:hypothetical protein
VALEVEDVGPAKRQDKHREVEGGNCPLRIRDLTAYLQVVQFE